MGNLLKTAALFAVGYLVGQVSLGREVDKGTIIHNDEDVYIKASNGKSYGWSWARVHYKNPDK